MTASSTNAIRRLQTEQEIRRIEQNIQNQQRELEAKLRANDELKEQMQNQ